MKVLSTVLLLLAGGFAAAQPNHSIQAIQDDVEHYLRANLDPALDYRIAINPIDPHLKLAACDQPLTLTPQAGLIKPGINTIGVRCPVAGWTIYSTVMIKAFQEVLVASKPIQRNETVRADQFGLEKRDLGTLQQGFIVDSDDVVNRQALRNIAVGSVLSPGQFADRTLVKRGDQVNIQSGRAGFLISASGIAMANGAKGQQIRVRNASSHRIVQAVVVDSGVVNVVF